MSVFNKIIEFLAFTWNEPKPFGIYHIICVLIEAVLIFYVVKYCRRVSDRGYRMLVLSLWGVMVVFEIYKQIVYSYTSGEGWDYSWYSFPFQLCSTPLYLLPLIAFLKDGNVRDACMAFIATYSLFGGLTVFAYPDTVFVETLGVNLQTMVHHGIQILLGVYTAVIMHKRIDRRFYLGATAVFALCLAVALILNLSVYEYLIAIGSTDSFNMFFISPYFNCDLPVFSNLIYPNVPYALFLAIYVFGFAFVAFIIYAAERALAKKFSGDLKNAEKEF